MGHPPSSESLGVRHDLGYHHWHDCVSVLHIWRSSTCALNYPVTQLRLRLGAVARHHHGVTFLRRSEFAS